MFCAVASLSSSLSSVWANVDHQHQNHQQNHQQNKKQTSVSALEENNKAACIDARIECAKTVTAAFAPTGDLWRVWAHQQRLYYQVSTDKGLHFSLAKMVAVIDEKISARNENRPKIAFDDYQGVYLSWAMPKEKKYTADVRFSYSSDYGKTFSTPVTVNNDNLLAGHSFNEMQVTGAGKVSIVWLDGRLSHQRRQQGKDSNGSALFYGVANPRENKFEFSNQLLVNGTCVCCRIAIDVNQQGELAMLWRHIYGDNLREFTLLTLAEKNKSKNEKPIQISNDHWKINGCPHQGGGLSINQENRYHMVWFNQGDKGKGIFYASSIDQGKTLTKPLSIGDLQLQAAHPDIMHTGQVVDIVWLQFNGVEHQLWHQQSLDNGQTFGDAKQLAQASDGADRPFIIQDKGINYVSWQRPKGEPWLQAL